MRIGQQQAGIRCLARTRGDSLRPSVTAQTGQAWNRYRNACLLIATLAWTGSATGNERVVLTPVNVFAESKINEVRRDKFPQFDGIGLVQRSADVSGDATAPNPSKPFANAVMIGPCTVITNYHVNYGDAVIIGRKRNYNLILSIGYSSLKAFAQSSEITPIIYGDQDSFDYAVNADQTCSGLRFGYYKVSALNRYKLVKDHAKVMVAAFDPAGRMRISLGSVTGIDADTGYVMFSASTKPGSSSGAIFIVDDQSGELRLQGINIGAKGSDHKNFSFSEYSDDKANLFMSMEQILPDIRQRIIDDIETHPGINPLDKHVKLRK